MREIIFRGKRVDNGEWVYGDICHHDGKVSYIGQHPADGSMILHDLIPETVGQYTGLTDKNGERIFEGDIVKAIGSTYSGETIEATEVVYLKYHQLMYDIETSNEIEVIGNIHDNPELIGGSDNGC